MKAPYKTNRRERVSLAGEKESPRCFVSSRGDAGTGVGAAARSSTLVRKP